MPDPKVHSKPFARDVMVQAFLYASGELEGTEARSFERRLGEDQAARDALCQAVCVCQPLGSQTEAGPDPRYREAVRRRLRSEAKKRERLGKAAARSSQPLFWGLLGAAAAALLTLGVERSCFPVIGGSGGRTTVPGGHSTAANGAADPGPALPNEVPSAWADLPNSEHLRTAHAEEMRRRSRAEEFHRLATPYGQQRHILAPHPLLN